jgi:hypothetical protein
MEVLGEGAMNQEKTVEAIEAEAAVKSANGGRLIFN